MNESFKVFIDSVSNHNFFCMRINNFTALIIWKNTFETSCTISASYLEEPLGESIQSIQFGQRLPPPCSSHLSVFPIALFVHSGSLQRLSPPCSTHLSVLPSAPLLHQGSLHIFFGIFYNINFILLIKIKIIFFYFFLARSKKSSQTFNQLIMMDIQAVKLTDAIN